MQNKKLKSWEELTLADNFIFQKLMRNEKICKKILSEILNKKIDRIVYPDYEKTIDIRYDSKAIRLDLYVEGEDEIYNVEMQNISYEYLPQRGRYYQDLIDLDLLEKGKEYGELCQSYVIFICTFDFYQLQQYIYTFTNQCHEVDGLEYGDLTTKIILNTKGAKGRLSSDLKAFLSAVDGIFSNDDFSNTIKEEYDKIKKSGEFRREYMTLGLELLEQYQRGLKEGIEEGRGQGVIEGQERLLRALEALKNGEPMKAIVEKYGVEEKLLEEYQKVINK